MAEDAEPGDVTMLQAYSAHMLFGPVPALLAPLVTDLDDVMGLMAAAAPVDGEPDLSAIHSDVLMDMVQACPCTPSHSRLAGVQELQLMLQFVRDMGRHGLCQDPEQEESRVACLHVLRAGLELAARDAAANASRDVEAPVPAAAAPAAAAPAAGVGTAAEAVQKDHPTVDVVVIEDDELDQDLISVFKDMHIVPSAPTDVSDCRTFMEARDLARLKDGMWVNESCIEFYCFGNIACQMRDNGTLNRFVMESAHLGLKMRKEEPAAPATATATTPAAPTAAPAASKKATGKMSTARHMDELLRTWWRKSEMRWFKCEYVFIPWSNANGKCNGSHWSLAVLCHIPHLQRKLRALADAALARHHKATATGQAGLSECGTSMLAPAAAALQQPTPVILHLDSHPGVDGHAPDEIAQLLRQAVWVQWLRTDPQMKELPPEEAALLLRSSCPITDEVLPVYQPPVPQQQNGYDCALFMLTNVEYFADANPGEINLPVLQAALKKAPATGPSHFMGTAWYDVDVAHHLRARMRRLALQSWIEQAPGCLTTGVESAVSSAQHELASEEKWAAEAAQAAEVKGNPITQYIEPKRYGAVREQVHEYRKRARH